MRTGPGSRGSSGSHFARIPLPAEADGATASPCDAVACLRPLAFTRNLTDPSSHAGRGFPRILRFADVARVSRENGGTRSPLETSIATKSSSRCSRQAMRKMVAAAGLVVGQGLETTVRGRWISGSFGARVRSGSGSSVKRRKWRVEGVRGEGIPLSGYL